MCHIKMCLVAVALLVSWLLAGSADALSCAGHDCSEVQCDPRVTEASCRGEYRRNGAQCWCCDACIPYADENQSCPRAVIIGVPPEVVCRPPLQCVEGICRRPRRH